jgi:hypothetical protein
MTHTETGTLFTAIAKLLPAEHREQFYRHVAHIENLGPHDDILHIAEAMGFLALLIRQTPNEIAAERSKFENRLASLEQALDRSLAQHDQLEHDLSALPADIQSFIRPDAIAAALVESIRQQFLQTGLPETATELTAHSNAIGQASKELALAFRQFAHPHEGAVSAVHQALARMQSHLANAANHIRLLSDTLKTQFRWSVFFLTGTALLVGFFAGFLYERLSFPH